MSRGKTPFVAEVPHLLAQWHPTRNLPTTPEEVRTGSKQECWWVCDRGHEYPQRVLGRRHGQGCPYCSGSKAAPENSLAARFPEVAARWHPTKNGDMTPEQVGTGSQKRFWFICPVGHEFDATPGNLTAKDAGTGCGYCNGKRVGENNSVAATLPHLVSEWHPTKNGDLTPHNVTRGSQKMIWWRCNRGHEWPAVMLSRTYGSGCPSCSDSTSKWELLMYCEMQGLFGAVKRRCKRHGVEIDVLIEDFNIAIEVDGAYWHRARESQDRAKDETLRSAGYLVIRLRENGLPLLSEYDIQSVSNEPTFEIVALVLEKILFCNVLADTHRQSVQNYIDGGCLRNEDAYRDLVSRLPGPPYEESLAALRPDIAEQWDCAANFPLTPDMFREKSAHRAIWRCEKGHQFPARIYHRSNGRKCPYCQNKKTCLDNCLATKFPNIADEWHSEKNGDLTPFDVTPGSDKNVWWICPEGHEYKTQVFTRTSSKFEGNGCAVCYGHTAPPDIKTSLAMCRSDIAAEWHPTRNGSLQPTDVRPSSSRKVWWVCPAGHEYETSIHTRTDKRATGNGCQECYSLRRRKTAWIKHPGQGNLPF